MEYHTNEHFEMVLQEPTKIAEADFPPTNTFRSTRNQNQFEYEQNKSVIRP